MSDFGSDSGWRIIRPKQDLAAFDPAELWRFRDLLNNLALRDIRLRYLQAALGIIWVIFQPLVGGVIFTVLFNRVAGIELTSKVPYFLFALVGFASWSSFSGTFSKASLSLLQNAQMISKVFFPRIVLPLSTVYGTLLDFGVALAAVLIGLVVFQVPPTLAILTFPLWLLLIQTLALGLGMMAGAIAVSYRDVQYALPVLLSMGTFAAPVGYPLSEAMSRVGPTLAPFFWANPMSGLIDAMRWSLLGEPVHSWGLIAYDAAFAVLAFVLGTAVFRKLERRFADVI
jgi:lipopolysaccharide transport system permease protein